MTVNTARITNRTPYSLSDSSITIGHKDLIDIAQALGYKSSPDGICSGLTAMGRRAFFMGATGVLSYNTRIQKLDDLFLKKSKDATAVATEIQSIVTKIQNKETVDPELKQNCFDYFAFFDGVELYQQSGLYPHLFRQYARSSESKSIKAVSLITSPSDLKSKKITAPVFTFSGVYSFPELISYIVQLRNLFEKTLRNNGMVTVSFSDLSHVTSIGYNTKDRIWIRIDSWKLPLVKISTDLEVANILRTEFRTKTFVLKTEISTLKQDASFLKKQLQIYFKTKSFKQLHRVTQKKTELVTCKNNYSWLLTASSHGDRRTIQSLLDAGANVNTCDNENNTPLLLAVEYGDANIVKLLLKAGADVNACQSNGGSPLLLAAEYGHAYIVKLLLDAGAAVNSRDQTRSTSLLIAAQNGNVDVVKILLKSKAKVDTYNNQQVTPLWKAAFKGHTLVVRLLLGAGADPTLRCKTLGSPIEIASQTGRSSIVEILKNPDRCKKTTFARSYRKI